MMFFVSFNCFVVINISIIIIIISNTTTTPTPSSPPPLSRRYQRLDHHLTQQLYISVMLAHKVPAASAISLPPWLLSSAAALFDCAYSKTPSTVRSQYAAAAAAQPLSSVELTSGAETASATNVIDGLLLLLEQALLQVIPPLYLNATPSPCPREPHPPVSNLDLLCAASAQSYVGRSAQVS